MEVRRGFQHNQIRRRAFSVWLALISRRPDGEQIVDRQNDVIEPEDLEEAAYEYVLNFRDGGVDHNADMRKKAKLVESVVFTKEKMKAMGIEEGTVPEGWWIGFKVLDDDVWQGIKTGKYKMFSIEGKGERVDIETPPRTFKEILQKYNPYRDPATGSFATGPGGYKTGGVTAEIKGQMKDAGITDMGLKEQLMQKRNLQQYGL